jgi:hypothetical protein
MNLSSHTNNYINNPLSLGNQIKEYFMIFPIEDVVFFSMIPKKYLVTGAKG